MNTGKIFDADIPESNKSNQILLPDGNHLPRPPKKQWPGDAHATVFLIETSKGGKNYRINLSPVKGFWNKAKSAGKKQALKSTAKYGVVAALEAVGVAAARVVGGVAVGVLWPSNITSEEVWRAPVANGVDVEVWMIGFK